MVINIITQRKQKVQALIGLSKKIKKELRRYKPFNVKIATEGSKSQEV